MRNTIIAIIAVLVIASGGYYYYTTTQNTTAQMAATPEAALIQEAGTVPATPEEEILQTEQVEASIDAEVSDLETTTF